MLIILSESHLQEENRLLKEENALLKLQVARMAMQMKDLEARMSKNSQNSNKPSSQSGYKKPNPKSQRGKSGKTSGGQPGHKGHTLGMVEHPDQIERHIVGTHCAECQCSLEEIEADIERRQETDIPPLKSIVIEHQVEVKKCKKCGRINKADAPVSAPTQYGKHVEALAVYLMHFQLLPLNRTKHIDLHVI